MLPLQISLQTLLILSSKVINSTTHSKAKTGPAQAIKTFVVSSVTGKNKISRMRRSRDAKRSPSSRLETEFIPTDVNSYGYLISKPNARQMLGRMKVNGHPVMRNVLSQITLSAPRESPANQNTRFPPSANLGFRWIM